MEREQRTDGFTALEDHFSGYEAYDPAGSKLGKVVDLFVSENDQPEYVSVKTGFLGTKSTLIPWQIVEVHDEGNRLVVAADKGAVKGGPAFDDDRKITPEYENRVYSYYGLENTQASGDRGGYAAHYGDSEGEHPGEVSTGMMMGDTGTGEFRGHGSEQEGLSQLGSDLEDEDELRVQRTEEELRAGTREREAGELRVRKNVRTDRESVEVPTRHEEVSVERVPLSGEASEAQIGEDEVNVPVTEEEIVVSKRPVVKEEIRIRKDVVEDTVVVEEDVRREEIDVEDQTTRSRGI
jgi:uncharacterized protein (TIGR02271 family)